MWRGVVPPSVFVVTVLSHRPTPPNADIMYMTMMASCTSVTSILRRRHAFSARSFGNRTLMGDGGTHRPKRMVPDT